MSSRPWIPLAMALPLLGVGAGCTSVLGDFSVGDAGVASDASSDALDGTTADAGDDTSSTSDASTDASGSTDDGGADALADGSDGGTSCTCSAGEFCWLGACVRLTGITAGGGHGCALTTAGGVQCWGWGFSGQLGNGANSDSPVPVAVSGLSSGVTAITAGYWSTCALTSAGGVQCWGDGQFGELGNGSTTGSNVPVPVSGLSSSVTAIAAGEYHVCALTSGGGVQCWGGNSAGELGNGSTTNSSVPVGVSGLSSGVKAIAAGGNHTCALLSGGTVQCWGGDTSGQLGNNTQGTSFDTPVAVAGLTSAAAIALGSGFSCALTSGGGVQCWGDNQYGELGNNSPGTNSSVPVTVSGLTGVTALGAGNEHACAVASGGGLQCWGYSQYGQLGNGSTTQSNVPGAVSGLSTGVATVAGGQYHTCALTTAGAALCWGWNMYGQLGNNSKNQSDVPVSVTEP